MFNKIIQSIDVEILGRANINPWTNIYGLSRSFIAMGLLITLLFTDVEYLFPLNKGVFIKQPVFDLEYYSIFYILRDNLQAASLISIIVLSSVVFGILPQLTGVLHWWITYSYMTSGVIIEGGDQIASIVTLLFIPITITDKRLTHWSQPIECQRKNIKLFVWSIFFIICLQSAIIYFHAAVAKLGVDEWLNGTAVYYWFTHNNFGVPISIRKETASLFANSTISTFFSWGTMLFEILLFGWLFMKRNSWNWKVLFISAVLFHFGIALVHGLVSFLMNMIGLLIIYFFPLRKTINLNFSKFIKSKL